MSCVVACNGAPSPRLPRRHPAPQEKGAGGAAAEVCYTRASTDCSLAQRGANSPELSKSLRQTPPPVAWCRRPEAARSRSKKHGGLCAAAPRRGTGLSLILSSVSTAAFLGASRARTLRPLLSFFPFVFRLLRLVMRHFCRFPVFLVARPCACDNRSITIAAAERSSISTALDNAFLYVPTSAGDCVVSESLRSSMARRYNASSPFAA